MKAVTLCFFAIALLTGNFALAQTAQTQQGAGASGADTSSANYQAKVITGEPANGRSASANYIYDHGTTWGGMATSTPPAPPPSTPPPSGGGPSGGGGTPSLVVGGSGSGDGGGGGGGIAPAIGGVSPAVDQAIAREIAQSVSNAETVVVSEEQIVPYIEKTLQTDFTRPRVIQIVDQNNIVRGIVILLLSRVIPWPFWLILLFLVAGAYMFTRLRRDGAWQRENMWLASGLIVAGVTLLWATRSIYAIDPASFGINETTTATIVQPIHAGSVVQGIVDAKSIGVHRISMVNNNGEEIMKITIFVKGALIF